MTDITIFQCIPAYRAQPTNRVIAKLRKLNCRILLDLEDSIKDIEIPGKSSLLKEKARIELVNIFALNPEFKFDVRINSPHTAEYKKDIELIKHYKQNLESIFIPKTESVEDIYTVVHDLGEGIKMNPIFETLNGIKNKEHICVPQISGMIEFFFYGNYDFHLDANIFPIHEQNTEPYWRIIESLAKTIESGFNFGNSPYSNLNDFETLRYSLFRLKSICKKPFAVMSLHKSQTLDYIKLQPCDIHSNILSSDKKQVIDTYISGKLKGRSFAIDKGTNRIITPQEYLLAVNNISY